MLVVLREAYGKKAFESIERVKIHPSNDAFSFLTLVQNKIVESFYPYSTTGILINEVHIKGKW